MDPSRRRNLIALIHVAKRSLALDEPVYRDALTAATGKESTKEMTEPELHRVIDHFVSLGFEVVSQTKPKPKLDPLSGKIHALWHELHSSGKINSDSEEALQAFVRRMTRVDALRWCSVPQKIMLVESLKKWLARSEVAQ